jgi:L-lactate utilization protein LutB
LHKYSYHFRLTETLFESPAYRGVPWRALTEFESAFIKACDNLNVARQKVLDRYDEIRQEVITTFRRMKLDAAREKLQETLSPLQESAAQLRAQIYIRVNKSEALLLAVQAVGPS